jgi:hypothetical protein
MLNLETPDYEAMLLGALTATAVTFGAHFTPSTSADSDRQAVRRSSAKEVDLQLQAVKKQTESQFPVVFLLGAPMTPRQVLQLAISLIYINLRFDSDRKLHGDC